MILVDSREHQHAIENILAAFDAAGVAHASTKLFVGDYQEVGNGLLVVDRKQSLSEVASNFCQQHERFRAELERARSAGIRLVVLVEHSQQIRSIEDVSGWKNPRLRISPGAMTGERMAKVMRTMTDRYGVEWQFCDKRHTGQRIMELLGVNDGKARLDQN